MNVLGQINFVEVISTKGSSTFGALAEARVIAVPNTLRAEDMETLGKDSILLASTAAGTVQLSLEGGMAVVRSPSVQQMLCAQYV